MPAKEVNLDVLPPIHLISDPTTLDQESLDVVAAVRPHGTRVIVNDRLDIALVSGARAAARSGRVNAPLVALSIAGTDSGGAAGLAADLPTFAALGAHGACAVTAVTAQDATGVGRIVPLTTSSTWELGRGRGPVAHIFVPTTQEN